MCGLKDGGEGTGSALPMGVIGVGVGETGRFTRGGEEDEEIGAGVGGMVAPADEGIDRDSTSTTGVGLLASFGIEEKSYASLGCQETESVMRILRVFSTKTLKDL